MILMSNNVNSIVILLTFIVLVSHQFSQGQWFPNELASSFAILSPAESVRFAVQGRFLCYGSPQTKVLFRLGPGPWLDNMSVPDL